MYYVYILQSLKNLNYYTGLTKDIERRLQEHNSKQTKSNKSYAPFKIVYTEKCKTLSEARAREKFLKSGTGREFRNKILKNNIPA
ncbi:GIY-YIG nuclease family protein [Patescibacteria group bacterium]|nr:GIY-YIG nuclease family protein [Patescibacteria group bacterium]